MFHCCFNKLSSVLSARPPIFSSVQFKHGGASLAMKYSRDNPRAAAIAIQSTFRGYLVRRTKPLKHLRVIRNVRLELQRLDAQLSTDPRLFESLRRDPQERNKWSEGGMALLLKLDSMQGVHPVVRDNRKLLTKEVISYQEYIDSAGKGGPGANYGGRVGPAYREIPSQAHVPYAPPSGLGGGFPPPFASPAPGHLQHSYSSRESYGTHPPSNVPPGSQPQAHIPYVPTGPGQSPMYSAPGQGPPYSQYPMPEKSYPNQGYENRFPQGTEPDIIDLFRRADVDGSGSIDAKELSRILSLKFFNFSRRTVRLMLHLFSDSTTASASRLGAASFVKLWKELKKWQRVFKSFDINSSGTIDLGELREAMLSLGIGVTPQVLQLLVNNYDRTGRNSSIAFGDFIECGLIVKGLTEKFISHDPSYTGAAKIDYQAFMMMVLPFIVA